MLQLDVLNNDEKLLQIPEQMQRLDKEIECFREELHHFISRIYIIKRQEPQVTEIPPKEQVFDCELAEYLRQKSGQVRTFRDVVKHETSLLEI